MSSNSLFLEADVIWNLSKLILLINKYVSTPRFDGFFNRVMLIFRCKIKEIMIQCRRKSIQKQ